MASVVLAVPEHSLRAFCDLLDYGLLYAEHTDANAATFEALYQWIGDQRAYMASWEED